MKKKRTIIVVIAIVTCITIGSLIFINQKNKKSNEKVEKQIKIKKEVIVPVMSELLKADDYFDKLENSKSAKITYYIDDSEVEFEEKYKEIGKYKVVINYNGKNYTTTLKVVDTQSPVVETKELEITKDSEYNAKDFIVSCNDNSEKECLITFKEENAYKDVGIYDITILAKDESGNATEKQTKLIIKENTVKDSKSNSKEKNTTSKATTSKTNTTKTTTKIPKNNVKFVKRESEVSEEQSDFKYGIKAVVKTTKTYDLYSDGSKKNEKTTTKTTYDKSGYNASTEDLSAEAYQVYASNISLINGVLNYTNIYRDEVGIERLNLDSNLSIAATIRSMEMAYSGKFSHTRPNGTSCFNIFNEKGISASNKGENIAMGQRSAESVSTSWRNSPGHYENMIDANFKKIGIGVFKFDGNFYWTQIFSD